jgi:predicted acetyltransferase
MTATRDDDARGGAAPRTVLRLRPLRLDDEPTFADAHRAMTAGGFTFGLGDTPGMPWAGYLRLLAERQTGVNLPPGFVPTTFLVADVSGKIVGGTSIRHALNDSLARQHGHIGYGVLPRYRRRGYATEILRQSLVILRAMGVDQVLVTCDDSNLASIAVIEACGGRLDSVIEMGPGMPRTRRYWIA